MTLRIDVARAESPSLASPTVIDAPKSDLWGTKSLSVPANVRSSRLADYFCLIKPEVTFLVLIATALGSYMAADSLSLVRLLNVVLGTGLIAAGTATLNHYLERFYDAQMRRTANRPLPAGRLDPKEVLRFGLALSVFGGLCLAVFVNLLTSLIGVLTLSTYLLVYTPLKRRTSWATFIGAFPGAAPVLMGWAGVRNSLDSGAWVLYAILFLWQFPHFLAIAWIYREDYQRAGMRMLPREDLKGDIAFRQILGYTLALIPVSALPSILGMTGDLYFYSVLLLGIAFFYFCYQASLLRSKLQAKVLLHVSVIYLPLIYALMVVDKAGQH